MGWNLISLQDTSANEKEILSCLLKDKGSRIEAISMLKVDYFSSNLNQRLFRTLETMNRNDEEIDLVLTLQKMESLGLRKDGDITSVSEIYKELSTAATLRSHIDNLIESYRSNQFKKIMFNYVTSNELLDPDAAINSLSKVIENKKSEDTSPINLQEWLLTEIGERMELEKPKPLGLLTGYRDLDKILKGVVPGSLVTLLARSGVGKTTISIDLTKNIALRNEPVAYFSLEMPPEQIYLKMVLAQSSLKIDDYISLTKYSGNVVDNLISASTILTNLNIKFSQENDVRKIINLINYYVRKEKTKVFFIDYLNILKSEIKANNSDELYNQITADLKQVALKTGAIIFLIVQSHRGVDSQQDKRPNLKDIKSSSSIEQNSDYIIALYRNLVFNNPVKTTELFNEGKLNYSIPNADFNPNAFELIVLKNRHTGECGTAYLRYSQKSGYSNWKY